MLLTDAKHDGSIFENQRPRQGASFGVVAAGIVARHMHACHAR